MKLTINGAKVDSKNVTNVAQLLKSIHPNGDHMAVLVNDTVVRKTERKHHILKDGDHIEILTFAGGG